MHRLDGHNTGPKQHRRRGGRRWFPKASESTQMHKKKKKKSSITKWECCENKKKISRFLVSVLRCFKEAQRGSVEILCMQILCFQLRLAINTDNKC